MERGSRLVVGITGGSGSGKTTLAHALAQRFSAAHLSLDDYYHHDPSLTLEDRRRKNWDHPAAFDFAGLASSLAALRRGETAPARRWDFETSTPIHVTEILQPSPVILVEGILLCFDPDLRATIDLLIFLDAPIDVLRERRVRRDVSERGRSAEHTLWQYEAMVRPMHETHVAPYAATADLILDARRSPDELAGAVTQMIERLIHDERLDR